VTEHVELQRLVRNWNCIVAAMLVQSVAVKATKVLLSWRQRLQGASMLAQCVTATTTLDCNEQVRTEVHDRMHVQMPARFKGASLFASARGGPSTQARREGM